MCVCVFVFVFLRLCVRGHIPKRTSGDATTCRACRACAQKARGGLPGGNWPGGGGEATRRTWVSIDLVLFGRGGARGGAGRKGVCVCVCVCVEEGGGERERERGERGALRES